MTGGEIFYKGKDLVKLSEKEMQKLRGNEISMIFSGAHDLAEPDYPVREADRGIPKTAPRHE